LEKLTIDTSDVTNLAMTDYGVLPAGAVERALAQGEAGDGEAGGGAAAPQGEAGEEGRVGEGETVCPRCAHVFRPRRPGDDR
jgi:hypothetical protein